VRELFHVKGDPAAALGYDDAAAFAVALLQGVPPPPADQAAIVAANRRGALTPV